ncbi:MAG: hypothetical protein GTO54_06650, partial [Nitrososphaeria archaeon]|nr:hypothetical protein [Nitrososphaeria archaeon]
LCMSTQERDAFLVYFPVGGRVSLNLPEEPDSEDSWFDPRTGKIEQASGIVEGKKIGFETPDKEDWVLILQKRSQS